MDLLQLTSKGLHCALGDFYIDPWKKVEKVAQFRDLYPTELVLVKGNHVCYTSFPKSWGIVKETHFYLDQFSFVHEQKARGEVSVFRSYSSHDET